MRAAYLLLRAAGTAGRPGAAARKAGDLLGHPAHETPDEMFEERAEPVSVPPRIGAGRTSPRRVKGDRHPHADKCARIVG